MTTLSRPQESSIHVSARGATVTGMPDPAEFCDLVAQLIASEEQAHWSVPDLLLWSETAGDEHYSQALDAAKLNPRTLANRLTIVRKFPEHTRQWDLSQRHYAQLTSLMPDNAALAYELLTLAERTGMTSEELLAEKKRRIHEPVPEVFEVTLMVDSVGAITPTVALPTWTRGQTFNVVLREAKAA